PDEEAQEGLTVFAAPSPRWRSRSGPVRVACSTANWQMLLRLRETMVARPRVEQAGFAPSPSQAWKNQGKRVRAAEGGGLENRCAATPHRGFESRRFRRVKGPRTCRRQR